MIKSVLKAAISFLFVFLCASCGSDDEDTDFNVVELAESLDRLDSLIFVMDYVDKNGSQPNEKDFRTLLSKKTQEPNLTFFAPTNEAFRKLDQTGDGRFTTSDLESLQVLFGNSQNTADALYLVLTNHFVLQKVLSVDFSEGANIVTLAEETSMDDVNYGLTVSPIESGFIVSPSYKPSEATVESADNEVSNGIVHIIDSVLLDDATASALGLSADES
jgi:uncharacterized surface protein with fasciclin (FAS1) repeats